MSPATYRRALLAPVLFLGAGACFATRQDLALVAADVTAMRGDVQGQRTAALARDSALHRSLDSALAKVASTMQVMADTLHAMQVTAMRLRGDVREDLQAIRQQLITVQELQGVSQRRLGELRAQLEEDTRERAATEGAPRDTVRKPASDTGKAPAAASAPATPPPPGPAQLLQMAQDQFRRGSNASARGAYSMLLAQYPTSDLAPEALYGVAETFAAEGNGVAADSVYNLVVTRFPASERAPTALYKRATALRVVGKTEEAKAIYQQVVDKYPKSDAALLAAGFLGPKKP